MIRGMYAGISGMKCQQTKLDTIGNNLSNVSTTGFKSSRVVFKDMMYQNSANAMGPSPSLGGSNAKQVGLGSGISGIDRTMTQGMMQPTGRPLDLAIDGDGFFMVSRGEVAHGKEDIKIGENKNIDAKNREIMYTRDGAFSLDSNGYLVTASGERVLGYSMDKGMESDGTINFVDANSKEKAKGEAGSLKTIRIPDRVKVSKNAEQKEETVELEEAKKGKKSKKKGVKEQENTQQAQAQQKEEYKKVMSYSIGKDGLITAVVEGGEVAVIGQLATASFANSCGLESIGNNMYLNSSNSGMPLISGCIGSDNTIKNGDIMQGMLEMSNVDIAEQFTDLIVTSRAFQASSKIISTTDEILQEVVNLKR